MEFKIGRAGVLALLMSTRIFSQHDHQHGESAVDSSQLQTVMSHAFSRHLPMNRNGSGTGWLPDASVMYGFGGHRGKWMFMEHHNLFLRYNHQDIFSKGSRGGKQFDAPAWLMFMGQRLAGQRGLFRFSVMLSADPFSVGGRGYPLLFQTGETYKGERLVDRQHPHDLFSELSLAYTHALSRDADITAYFGYPGEPALGPVAFMHRVSALNNPDAPLSHHWQDATHINYGVATLGIRLKILKLEASSFTGAEPDEHRYQFDPPRFDSYSMRLSCNPQPQLALQISHAFLKGPEAIRPDENVRRSTASVIHHLPFSQENRYLASALIWGLNQSDHSEHCLLLETNLQLDRSALYSRYEWVQKSASELDLAQFQNGHETLFNIQALTLGANHVLLRAFHFNLAMGLQATLYLQDPALTDIYGNRPMAAEVYLRFSPHVMQMRMAAKP